MDPTNDLGQDSSSIARRRGGTDLYGGRLFSPECQRIRVWSGLARARVGTRSVGAVLLASTNWEWRRMRDWAAPRVDGVVCVVVALTLVAAALRFAGIASQSYWGDEALTVSEIRTPLDGMLGLVLGQETTPPLYFVLAWGWAKVFGSGEAGLRSLSALAGTAMVPLAYLAAARLFSRRVGVIAAALAALNPFLIWYSQEARAYAIYMTLTALSFLCFVAALRSRESRWLAWWAVVSALALTAHFFAVFLVGTEAVWLLVALNGRRTAVAVGGVAAVGLALLPVAIVDTSHGTSWIAQSPLAERLGRTAGEFAVGPVARSSWFGGGLIVFAGAAAVVLAAIGLRMRGRQRRSAVLALAIGGSAVAIPLGMAALGADLLDPRNVAAAWLPLTVVVAAGLGSRRAGRAGAAGAALVCAGSLAVTVGVSMRPDLQRPDWRGVAAAMGPITSARAVIADASGAEPLRLYLPEVALGAASSPTLIREIALVRHIPGAGPNAGCRRLRCLPALPPTSAADAVRLSVRHARIGDYAVARWSLRHPVRVTPGRLLLATIHALDPQGKHRILVVLQDPRA
jgi:mannosyltransferase